MIKQTAISLTLLSIEKELSTDTCNSLNKCPVKTIYSLITTYVTFSKWQNYRNGKQTSNCHELTKGWSRREVDVDIKRHLNCCVLIVSMLISWLWYYTIVWQDAIIGGNLAIATCPLLLLLVPYHSHLEKHPRLSCQKKRSNTRCYHLVILNESWPIATHVNEVILSYSAASSLAGWWQKLEDSWSK